MENMPLKQKRGHQSRQKKRSETIENIWLEREVQNLEEPIMLR
jgi:serine/threonine-protein kinase RIO1